MPIRYYVDADLLGIAKILTPIRSDMTYPGDPGGLGRDGLPRDPCPIHPGAKDPDWLPLVAQQGWIVISRDRRQRSKPAERAAITEHSARVVTLDAKRQLSKWDELEILFCQWRAIEALTSAPGPWLYIASRTTLRAFDL